MYIFHLFFELTDIYKCVCVCVYIYIYMYIYIMILYILASQFKSIF